MIDIVDGEDRRISRRDRSSALRKNLRDAVKAVSARTAKGEPVEVPPVEVVHQPCGHPTHIVPTCSECGEVLSPFDLRVRRGPGAKPSTPVWEPAS